MHFSVTYIAHLEDNNTPYGMHGIQNTHTPPTLHTVLNTIIIFCSDI